MKKCKSCQSEIDSKATICPHCRTKQGPGKVATIIGVVIMLIIVGSIIGAINGGGKSSSTTNSNSNSNSGSSTSKPTQTTFKSIKVSEIYSSGNWQYEVTKISKAKTITWSDYGNSSDAKGEFVIIYLTLKNIGKENFSINDFDFELRDSKDIKYNSDFVGSSLSNYKKLTSLGEQMPPGVPIYTALVFDIAPDATGLKLILKQADNAQVILE